MKIAVLILLITIAFVFIYFSTPGKSEKALLAELKESNSQKVRVLALKSLLERFGAEEAQEKLLHSGLPFTGETHLLVHHIGEFIYRNSGLAGLPRCKDYFLSACYHGFLIKAFNDYGLDGLSEVMDECREKGDAVFMQCNHAAGHGFLALNDYDLLKALSMCDELGKKTSDFIYNSCYEGVFMENIWGVHNGMPSPNRWIKETDPYYPCNDPRIETRYLIGCFANQATLMYQLYNGDLRKTANGCDGIKDELYKKVCYNNFARQIHPLTNGQTERAFELCRFASGEYWQNYCLITVAVSAFNLGDQTKMPFEICRRIAEPWRSECYERLNKK